MSTTPRVAMPVEAERSQRPSFWPILFLILLTVTIIIIMVMALERPLAESVVVLSPDELMAANPELCVARRYQVAWAARHAEEVMAANPELMIARNVAWQPPLSYPRQALAVNPELRYYWFDREPLAVNPELKMHHAFMTAQEP